MEKEVRRLEHTGGGLRAFGLGWRAERRGGGFYRSNPANGLAYRAGKMGECAVGSYAGKARCSGAAVQRGRKPHAVLAGQLGCSGAGSAVQRVAGCQTGGMRGVTFFLSSTEGGCNSLPCEDNVRGRRQLFIWVSAVSWHWQWHWPWADTERVLLHMQRCSGSLAS